MKTRGLVYATLASHRMRPRIQLFPLLPLVLVGLVPPAWTATLGTPPAPTDLHVVCYVSPAGSPTNSGTPQSPWSVAYALDHAVAPSTISFLPGTYPSIVVTRPGLQLLSPTKWAAVILGSTNMHGIEVDAGNTIIDGFQISHTFIDGIKLNASSNTVRNCWIHHAGWGDPSAQTNSTGIYTGQGIYGGCHQRNTIEYNLIEYNGIWVGHDHGIYLCGTNHIIRGNVIRHNWTYGVQLYTGYAGESCSGIQIYNNLVYGNGVCDNGRNCLTVWAGPPGAGVATTNYIFNNTLIADTYYPVVCDYGFVGLTNNLILGSYDGSLIGVDGATLWCDYNLLTNALHVGSGVLDGGHNIVTTNQPGFVNPSNGLFWLLPTSPARSVANPQTSPPVSFFGVVQTGVTDIGAFQFNLSLSADTRVLDPSPPNPDYWAMP